jgi:hypothetical protein
MSLTLQPVRVANGHDEEGVLVFAQDRLLAVLVQLSDEHEEPEIVGRWFLETGFGRLDGPDHPTFPDLEAAQTWISRQLGL